MFVNGVTPARSTIHRPDRTDGHDRDHGRPPTPEDITIDATDLPTVTLRRRLEWVDTDAADRWHHGVVLRWAELAEAELHRDLGISDQTFGWTPRVNYTANFHAAVHFDDEVEITFAVASLGRTSVTYTFEVVLVDGATAATGQVVTVFADDDGTRPWTDDLRAALGGA